jgi:hypothetical protein
MDKSKSPCIKQDAIPHSIRARIIVVLMKAITSAKALAICQNDRKPLLFEGFRGKSGEPVIRFELMTNGLQNRCSTTELNRHGLTQ